MKLREFTLILICLDLCQPISLRVIFRDVHSAAVAVRAMRVHHRLALHAPQVPDWPGHHAARLAGHRNARHPSAHCCRTGEPPTAQYVQELYTFFFPLPYLFLLKQTKINAQTKSKNKFR